MQDRTEVVNSLINQLKLACPSSATPILVKLEAEFERQTTEIEAFAMVQGGPAICDRWQRAGFTEYQCRMLRALEQAGDRGLSYDALYSAMYSTEPEVDWPDAEITKVRACHIRKKLAQKKIPFNIVTIWGKGFRLERGNQEFSEKNYNQKYCAQPKSGEKHAA